MKSKETDVLIFYPLTLSYSRHYFLYFALLKHLLLSNFLLLLLYISLFVILISTSLSSLSFLIHLFQSQFSFYSNSSLYDPTIFFSFMLRPLKVSFFCNSLLKYTLYPFTGTVLALNNLT